MNNRESFDELLYDYWNLAYKEGKTGESQGDKANEVLHKLRTALASQAQQESQWISVEERLPEMAQKVFGIYDAGMCAFMRVRSEDDTWCWAIGRNDLYDDFFYDVDDDYQVTHWMPLPPAPEGDKE